MITGSVNWIDCRNEVPDEELTVLIALCNGETDIGYCDAGEWHDIGGMPMQYAAPDLRVTHWAEFPAAPREVAA